MTVLRPPSVYSPEEMKLRRAVSNAVMATLRHQVYRRDQYRCVYCKAPGESLDHVVPLSLGGEDSLDNLVTSCLSCNARLGNVPLKTVRRRQIYLEQLWKIEPRIHETLYACCAACFGAFQPGVKGSSNLMCADCLALEDLQVDIKMSKRLREEAFRSAIGINSAHSSIATRRSSKSVGRNKAPSAFEKISRKLSERVF